jgi:ParB-like chromosome segregation protein Spo0J
LSARDAALAEKLGYIDIDAIEVRSHLRTLDEAEVARLQKSLAHRGLLHPLLIHFEQGDDGPVPVLVAGLYRLAAAQRLGWRRIHCREIKGSPTELELVEIDENVARVNLSPAQEALYLGRRHDLYERLHGPAKGRGAHAANAAMHRYNAIANLAPAFATATAAITGAAERTIQRGVARARALGPELLQRIAGTSLDSGVELDALAALAPKRREELIDRAARGEQVSASERKTAKEPLSSRQSERRQEPVEDPDDAASVASTADCPYEVEAALAALKSAWLRASTQARGLFMTWLASQ